MREKQFGLVMLIVLMLVVCLCGFTTNNENKQRIICLAPNSVEVLYSLGLENNIVGWSRYVDYPPKVTKVRGWIRYQDYKYVSIEDELNKQIAVVSDYGNYNKELVKELNPTLILACESYQQGMAEELKAQGYNVLYHNPRTLEDVFQMILDVGKATGTSKKAEKLITGYREEINEIQKITKDLPRVKTYMEIDYKGPWTVGSGSPLDQIIEIAGGINIFHEQSASYFKANNEEVIFQNPDVILTPLWPEAGVEEVTTIREIAMRPGYEKTKAVQKDRIYHYDSSLFKRPGPRIVTAIRKLAYLLHPYYFKNPEKSVSPWELGKIDDTYTPPAPLE
jgi:iron complex transport system substrate-binding protein